MKILYIDKNEFNIDQAYEMGREFLRVCNKANEIGLVLLPPGVFVRETKDISLEELRGLLTNYETQVIGKNF